MMLSDRNVFVRLAYGTFPPAQTNLCALFWRCLFKLWLLLVLGVFLGVLLSFAIVYWREILIPALVVVAIIIGSIVVTVVTDSVSRYLFLRRMTYREPSRLSVVTRDIVRAIKGKYCPTIMVTHKE